MVLPGTPFPTTLVVDVGKSRMYLHARKGVWNTGVAVVIGYVSVIPLVYDSDEYAGWEYGLSEEFHNGLRAESILEGCKGYEHGSGVTPFIKSMHIAAT
jgi:hypothetical protein